MSDLDIGLVVINAGVVTDGRFEYTEPEKLQAMLDLNTYQVGAMMIKFAKRFSQREARSGFIVISSLAGTIPMPGNLVYSATKAFGRYLSNAISWELN